MTLDDLTVNFAHLDSEQVLADWRWLLLPSRSPILITATGNAFVQDESSNEIHFLDAGSAHIVSVAGSVSEFSTLLQQREFVLRFFDVNLVAELRKSVSLPTGSLYGFKILPTLGGEYNPSNFEPTNIEVHFSISGQLQQKIKDLPPGTPIDQVSIA